MRRFDAAHPLVPTAIAGALVAGVVAAQSVAPADLRGTAVLVIAAAVLIAAFLAAPKASLLVFAIFVLLYDTIALYLGPTVKQIDELCIPAFVLIAAVRIKPWQRQYVHVVRDVAVTVVVLLAIVSSIANGVPVGTWMPGLLLLVKVIAFLYVVMWHTYRPADIRQFGIAVIAIGVIVVSLGYVELIDQRAFREFLRFDQAPFPRGQLPSITSIFQHPEMLAWLGTFVSLFAFGYYVVYRRWWMLAAGLFFSTAAVLTARRRAILGVVAGLLGGFAAQARARLPLRHLARRWLPVGAAIMVLGIAFFPSLLSLVNQTVGEFRPPASAPPPDTSAPPAPSDENARLSLYFTSVAVARDHFPLGAGLGRYGSWMSRVDYSPVYSAYGLDRVSGLSPEFPSYITDTFWPQILGEIGLLGLIAYLVWTGVVGLYVWRATRLMRDPFVYAFCLSTLMVFLHALVETVFSSLFHSPPKVYLIFGAVGIVLALLRSHGSTTADTSAPAGAQAEHLTRPGRPTA